MRVSTGRDLATGKYKRVNRNFTGTKSEAQAALRELIKDLDGRNAPTGKTTYDVYSSLWLKRIKETKARGTYTRYSELIATGMLHLRKARMCEITHDVMQGIYAKLANGETMSGKPWTGTTIRKFANVHHAMFKAAKCDGVMVDNPCDYASAPASDTKERNVIPAEKLSELIDCLDPKEPAQFCIRMILRLGLRRGEAAALCISDFDFDNCMVSISKTLDKAGNIKDTKTEAGRRTLPLPPQVIEDVNLRIEAIKDNFRKMYEDAGIRIFLDKNTPLMCNNVGVIQRADCIRRWWERNREALGFSGITIHDLRHSYLTAVARKKVDPKLLQKLAGHAKYSTTMQIYVHADSEDLRAAVSVVDW